MSVSVESEVRTGLPVLEDNATLRYFAFAALYVAQGVPEGLIFYALPAWLATQGCTPAQIGSYAGAALLPWTFKLVNAPLMDRFSYLPMGRRRPWVLLGQAGLVLAFLHFSTVRDPANNLVWLTAAGFIVSLFGSFQDVATDGMAIDILPLDQQARANGVMWGAKVIGTAASVYVSGQLLSTWGFNATGLILSGTIAVIMLVPLLVRERRGERVLPWTQGRVSEAAAKAQLDNWAGIFVSLRKVFFLRVSVVMGAAVFAISVGRGVVDTYLPVVTVQELGWTDTDYSSVFASATLVAGFIGMFAGGALVDFFGKVRMLEVFMGALMVVVASMVLLASDWGNRTLVIAFIVMFYSLVCCMTIAVFAVAMQLCWTRVAATQFTIYMAISNLGLAIGAWVFGRLSTVYEPPVVLGSYLVFVGVALLIMPLVSLEWHRPELERLERDNPVT